MREPTILSSYTDQNRNITFEVLFYAALDEKQVRQILDEYYRRYQVPAPKNGSTVTVVCDNFGPRSPLRD